MPSIVNAIIIVCSRPRWSDTHPKNGRLTPFSTRFIDSANGSAGSVMPNSDTGESATPKSLAIGVSCAVAMSPPVAVSTNIDEHHPERRRAQHLERRVVARDRTDSCHASAWRATPNCASGAARNQLTRNTTAPCAMPNLRNVAS